MDFIASSTPAVTSLLASAGTQIFLILVATAGLAIGITLFIMGIRKVMKAMRGSH